MVAIATAQDKGFAARRSSRSTYLLVMLFPVPDSDRARLATGPFGPQPEHPDCALGREEAPARARDLPAPPDLVNLRNDNNTSKSQSRAHCSPQSVQLPTGLGISGREHIPDESVRMMVAKATAQGAHFSNCLILCGRKAHLQVGSWISRGSKTRGGKLLDHRAPDIDCEAHRATASSPAEAGVVRETSTARAPRKVPFPPAVISRGKIKQQLLEFPSHCGA